MIIRGQNIYSIQDEATTSPSSSDSEEAKGEGSSEEIYPQEERQPLMVKEEERTSIARFLRGLNMEVRDKVELLP